jgi:hypothetical protein
MMDCDRESMLGWCISCFGSKSGIGAGCFDVKSGLG